MKISLSHYGITHSVETPDDSLTGIEAIEYFLGIMASAGWQQSTIEDAIIELSENYHKETFDNASD